MLLRIYNRLDSAGGPNPLGDGDGVSNVISCENHEGVGHCQARCDGDPHCAGFGLYVSGPETGRCCTKRNNLGAHPWAAGVSYLKQVKPPQCPFAPSPSPHPPPPPPAPPSVPVSVSIIFRGNSSVTYNKGAMIELLPDGRCGFVPKNDGF